MNTRDEDGKEFLGLLEAIEDGFRRMIYGIINFICVKFPHLFRAVINFVRKLYHDFLIWLDRFIRFVVKLTVRLSRVAFFATVWTLLVFGPLMFVLWASFTLFLAILGVGWAVIGIMGSVWGLKRWRQQRTANQS